MHLETNLAARSNFEKRARDNKNIPIVGVSFAVFSFFILIILLIVVGGFGFYFYTRYSDLKDNPNTLSNEAEVAEIVEKVSKLMELPTDETPTLATVLDREKLQDQDFFKNAQNGDKVLAYVVAKKAILYRPSTNKIIEVAPIYISDGETEE